MKRFFASLLALAAAASASTTHATPVPLLRADGTWAEPVTRWAPVAWFSMDPIETTDVLDREDIITLDPATGATTGQLNLVLEAASGSVTEISFYMDRGLDVVMATSSQSNTTVTSELVQSFRFVTVRFDALAPGGQMTVSADFEGTLQCGDLGGYGLCDLQPTMSMAMAGSLLPYVIDQSNLGGYNVWGASRAIQLSLPSGTDIVTPGDVTLDTDDGTQHTMRFEIPPYHSPGAILTVFGDLDTVPVSGVSPPTTVHLAADSPTWGTEMAQWMKPIFDFIDAQAGQTVPWAQTDVVKLPGQWFSPGTAGHGIVLLAESYGEPSAAYFEETLAHETAHEWWGILVGPTDYGRSRWLVEGLATLSQLDYAADVLNPTSDRETYLGRRYREHDLVLRYTNQGPLPAVVPPFDINAGANDTLWAYFRSSVALDTLRLVIGEDVFAQALQTWASTCAMELCDTADFKDILEAESNLDLTAAFDAYVFDAAFPEPLLSFSQDGETVSVTATGAAHPLMLDLWLVFDDHTHRSVRTTLEPDTPTTLSIDRPVRAVRPNPRHDGAVRSRSLTDGDVTFDGAVDGLDIIACARAVDTVMLPGSGNEGLNRIDLDFSPRCDRDQNAAITMSDVDVVLTAFGTETP